MEQLPNQILDLISANPAWASLLGGVAADVILRKTPKAIPLLRIIAKVLLVLDSALEKVPGMKNKK